MKIGIPTEINPSESRVAATPKTVKKLIQQGFEVCLEQGAGQKANFSDRAFQEAGASLLPSAPEVYQQADIILKVLAPTPAEIPIMKEGTVLLSYLWPEQHPELLKKLAARKINAIAR